MSRVPELAVMTLNSSSGVPTTCRPIRQDQLADCTDSNQGHASDLVLVNLMSCCMVMSHGSKVLMLDD